MALAADCCYLVVKVVMGCIPFSFNLEEMWLWVADKERKMGKERGT